MLVSLIGTYHVERGAVTVAALLAILERLRPEVIFAEIPSSHINRWRDGSHSTLESVATARYAEAHSVEVIPVDLPEPDDSFFQDHEEMFRAVERTSPEFRRLMDLHTERMLCGGFVYLNSNECSKAWIDIKREERDTIEYIRDPRLHAIHTQVCDTMERRDEEMLSNIYSYCAHSDFGRGVFLVGSAHRGPIIEKSLELGRTISDLVEWDLSEFLTAL